MRIIIDAYQYSSAITGTDRMAFNFLAELQKIDRINSYTILCSRESYTKSSLTNKNFKKVTPPFICALPVVGRYFSYFWRQLVKLIVAIKKPDVYFSFHNMNLPGKRVAKKMIASNLDLIPVILDDYKGLGRLNYDAQLLEYQRVAALADNFISISEYSKLELAKTLDVPESKIRVIHLAADNSFMSMPHSKSMIDSNYIFTVGGSEPRKNVKTVIEAYEKLSNDMKKQYKLVIAGGKWHGQKLDYTANENIIELGYVLDEDLPSLYANSSVFVFASIYEGFGFTILEAMAAGTPVINAKGSSLDEVAGDATLSFEATDSAALTAQLTKTLRSPELRSKLIKKGHEQRQKFSWEKSATKLHQILTRD